jgi:DNA-binding response OmpR family regulator
VARVLVVEDDDAIAEPLVRALERDGYDTIRVATGGDVGPIVRGGVVDLVVLDLGLPDIDGVAVCRDIRRSDASLPILVLTARSEEVDVIIGLDAGADDYVTKPFRVGELLARVRARVRARSTNIMRVQNVEIDVAGRRAWHAENELELTAKEFDLLVLLAGNAGTVVTREEIMTTVWDEHWFGSTRTLDVHISWLRKKLGEDAASSRYITTVRGVGFRFEAG